MDRPVAAAVGQVVPRRQLIRLTGWLPTDLVARLLALLERRPALVGAARLRDAIDLNDATTRSWRWSPGLVGSRRTSPHRRQHGPELQVVTERCRLPAARPQPDSS